MSYRDPGPGRPGGTGLKMPLQYYLLVAAKWPLVVLDNLKAGLDAQSVLQLAGAALPWYLMRDRLGEVKDIALAYAGSGAAVALLQRYE